MGSNIIQIESLSHMSFDDVLSLYRQGYKLEERSVITRSLDIKSLATCPGTIQVGGSLTLSAIANAGTAPYHYNWTVTKPDGNVDTSLADQMSNTYIFDTAGIYGISVNVTDTCPTGAKTSNIDSCTVIATTLSTTNIGCNDPIVCPPDKNYCLIGYCVPKNYLIYGAVALVAIMALKK